MKFKMENQVCTVVQNITSSFVRQQLLDNTTEHSM